MPVTPWEFTVEDRCAIQGRGLAVFRSLDGEVIDWSFPAVCEKPDGQAMGIDEVHLEFARMARGEEQLALLLVGLGEDDVPIGSVIRQRVLTDQ